MSGYGGMSASDDEVPPFIGPLAVVGYGGNSDDDDDDVDGAPHLAIADEPVAQRRRIEVSL